MVGIGIARQQCRLKVSVKVKHRVKGQRTTNIGEGIARRPTLMLFLSLLSAESSASSQG